MRTLRTFFGALLSRIGLFALLTFAAFAAFFLGASFASRFFELMAALFRMSFEDLEDALAAARDEVEPKG